MRPDDVRQRGQALLLVVAFLAAFLLLIWASLRLASASFLTLAPIQADSRSTYALDAGVDFFIEYLRNKGGNLCTAALSPPALTLTYPSTTITVSVGSISAAPGCKKPKPVIDFTVSASGASRTLTAEVALVGGAWTVNWESFS